MTRAVQAAHYGLLGYAVFPCRGKIPATRNGFKDATRNAMRNLETFHEGYNIGLLAPANVIVLDFDVPAGNEPESDRVDTLRSTLKTLAGTYEELRAAPIHRTPSGGYHVFLKTENASHLKTGKFPATGEQLGDVRGLGRAYVIAPPSSTKDGEYKSLKRLTRPSELPQASAALLEWLRPSRPAQQARRTTQPVPPAAHGRARAYAIAAMTREVDTLSNATPGNRNHALNRAGYVLAGFIPHGLLSVDEVTDALMHAADNCGLLIDDGERAVTATINSAITTGSAKPRTLPDFEQQATR